mgnify:CR=1 FL=1
MADSSDVVHNRVAMLRARLAEIRTAYRRLAEGRGLEVRGGHVHLIPRGVERFIANTSRTEPLEVIGVYTGAGSLEEAGYVHQAVHELQHAIPAQGYLATDRLSFAQLDLSDGLLGLEFLDGHMFGPLLG